MSVRASCSDADARLSPMSSLGVVSISRLLAPVFRLFLPPQSLCSGVQGDREGRGGFRNAYRMVLPVLNRIHCGIGLFCFWALASFCFVRKVLWLCIHISSVSVSIK